MSSSKLKVVDGQVLCVFFEACTLQDADCKSQFAVSKFEWSVVTPYEEKNFSLSKCKKRKALPKNEE
jgi:hypothetical protein